MINLALGLPFLYLEEKKKLCGEEIFYVITIIMGIHALVIYFALCLSICIMVFMWIDIGIKRGVFKICNI